MSMPLGKGIGNIIFVGNLPWTATEDDLKALFGSIGPVVQVNITRFSETGRSKGWGIVEFRDRLSAETAVSRLNGSEYLSRVIHVRFDRSVVDADEADTVRVFVGNIPWDVSEDQLYQHFKGFPPRKIRLMTNMAGRSRGFALLQYDTIDQAEKSIISLNGTNLGGRDIQCRIDRGPGRESDLLAASEPRPSLFVRGLNSKCNDEILAAKFRPFGEVISAKVMYHNSGSSKGWGTVLFARMEDANQAVNELNGKPLFPGMAPCEVRLDKKKPVSVAEDN